MLTRVDELVLLAIAEDGRIRPVAGEPAFALALIGAALVDLSLRGRVDADLATLRVVDRAPTGIAVLDVVLDALVEAPSSPVAETVLGLSGLSAELGRLSLDHLVMRRVLEVQERKKFWSGQVRCYPIADGREFQEARERWAELLTREALPSPEDSALLGLARAGGVLVGWLSNADLDRLESRLVAVAGLDLIVRGAEQAIARQARQRAEAILAVSR
jgi:hypothetical protein